MSPGSTAKHSSIECKISEGIACLKVGHGAFVLGTSIEDKVSLFNLFAELERSDEVKAVLLFNTPDAFTEVEHRRYIESLTELSDDQHVEQAVRLLGREVNALHQYALMAMRYEKLLVSCLSGEIASPFLALSLTSDLRWAEEDMSFRLSHVNLGVPPVGGLGFLLPKFVGQGQSVEWLVSGGTINADEAHRTGLINAIITSATFEAECIARTKKILDFGVNHIRASRKLIYHDWEAFRHFLRKESEIKLHEFYRAHKP